MPTPTPTPPSSPVSIAAFCAQHGACVPGAAWAAKQPEKRMRDLWRRSDLRPEWRIWVATRPGVMCDRDTRLFACWCATCTPLGDGRTSAALLTDPRSREAVRVTVRYALGAASAEQLATAYTTAARAAAAAYAAYAAARAAAAYAAYAAARAAAAAAYAAADAAADADAARKAQAAHLLTLLPEFPL